MNKSLIHNEFSSCPNNNRGGLLLEPKLLNLLQEFVRVRQAAQ